MLQSLEEVRKAQVRFYPLAPQSWFLLYGYFQNTLLAICKQSISMIRADFVNFTVKILCVSPNLPVLIAKNCCEITPVLKNEVRHNM